MTIGLTYMSSIWLACPKLSGILLVKLTHIRTFWVNLANNCASFSRSGFSSQRAYICRLISCSTMHWKMILFCWSLYTYCVINFFIIWMWFCTSQLEDKNVVNLLFDVLFNNLVTLKSFLCKFWIIILKETYTLMVVHAIKLVFI